MNACKFGTLTLLLFLVVGLAAQAPNSFAVHLNKPYYITGETVWYKVYSPAQASTSDFAVKGILADGEGEIAQSFFHKTVGGAHFTGQIDLPYNYASGLYQLVFKINPNDSEEEVTIAQVPIPIYNDLSYGTPAETERLVLDAQGEVTSEGLQIKITAPSGDLSNNVNFRSTVEVMDSEGNPVSADLSVAVTSAEVHQAEKWGYGNYYVGTNLEASSYQSALADVYVTGHVYTDDNEPLQANVLGAYASNQNKIYYTKSDKMGRFTLPMEDFYVNQTVQLIPYFKEAESIKVKLTQDEIPALKSNNLIYNDQIETALEDSRQRKKIAQHFEKVRSASAEQAYADEVQTLKPNFTFYIAEYEKFDRIYDFFTELMTPLEFKKTQGKYFASMSNPKATRVQFFKLGGSPLFLVDGKVTRNADFVAQLSMSNIESIDIFYSPEELRRQFNVLGSGGVVKINTVIPVFDFPEDDSNDLFEVKGLQQKATFSSYANESDRRLPHFDPVQFWNPSLTTDDSGRATLEFPQNDDTGEFIIHIIGQDNSGKRGSATMNYSVPVN